MRCICCERRKRRLNEFNLCPDCSVCLHCEQRPAETELALCRRCHDKPHIGELYRRSHHWTPDWELHLRRKTAEMQAQLRAQVSEAS